MASIEKIRRMEKWLDAMDREVTFLNQKKEAGQTLTSEEERQIKIFNIKSKIVFNFYKP